MANFDVNNQARRVVYQGSGFTNNFYFNFQVNNTSEIEVRVDNVLQVEGSQSNEQYQIKDSNGNLGLNADGTGVVVFNDYPGNVASPPQGSAVTVMSKIPSSRASVYTSGGNITAASLESDFDTQTMLLGDRIERENRTILAPVTDPTQNPPNYILPTIDDRKGKTLGFNSTTGSVEMVDSLFLKVAGETFTGSDHNNNSFVEVKTGLDQKLFINGFGNVNTIVGRDGNDDVSVQIKVEDATTSAKGIASFNSTYFSVDGQSDPNPGKVSLIANQFAIDKIGPSSSKHIDMTNGFTFDFNSTHSLKLSNSSVNTAGTDNYSGMGIILNEENEDFFIGINDGGVAKYPFVIDASIPKAIFTGLTVDINNGGIKLRNTSSSSGPSVHLNATPSISASRFIYFPDASGTLLLGDNSGNVTITGNLTVQGTTTTVDSNTVNIGDHNIVLDSDNNTSAVVNGAGITIEGGSGLDAKFTYNTTGPKFELKLGDNYEDLQVDKIIAASISLGGTLISADANEINKLDGVTATTNEFNYLDITTLGTVEASKVLTADANGDVSFPAGSRLSLRTTSANNPALLIEGSGPNELMFAGDHTGSTIADKKVDGVSLLYRTTPNDLEIIRSETSGLLAKFSNGNSNTGTLPRVELYHNNVKKLETTANGVTVDGLKLQDNKTITLGTDDDATITHTGSNLEIDNNTGITKFFTGQLYIQGQFGSSDETMAQFSKNGAVQLYYDNELRFRTTSTGIDVLSTDDDNSSDNVANIRIISEGTNEILTIRSNDGVGSYISRNGDNYGTHLFQGFGGTESPDTVNMLRLTSTGHTFEQDVTVNGDVTLKGGTNNQLRFLSADGTSQGYQIKANISDTADFGLLIEDKDDNDIAKFLDGGECLLTHNHNTKFQTTATGVTVTGSIVADGLNLGDSETINLGAGNDATIKHTGASGRFELLNDVGSIIIRTTSNDSDVVLQTDNGSGGFATYVRADGSTGAVQLSHYNDVKFSTTSTGAALTGDLELSNADGDADADPTILLKRESSSPAFNNQLGELVFQGRNTAAENVDYGRITTKIATVTDGNEGGNLSFNVLEGGNEAEFMAMGFNNIFAYKQLTMFNNIFLDGNHSIIWDGATNDSNTTSLVVTDPTADRTITLPDASGTVLVNTGDTVTITDTGSGNADGPILNLFRNSASPATNDQIGEVRFLGKNDAGQDVEYGSISSSLIDATDGSEDARTEIRGMLNGVNTTYYQAKFGINEFQKVVKISPGNYISFEGATDNTNETLLQVTDPTADRTITLPDATGVVSLREELKGNATNGAGVFSDELVARKLHTGTILSHQTDSSQGLIAGRPMGAFFSQASLTSGKIFFMPIMIPGTGASDNFTIGSFKYRVGFSGTTANNAVKMGLYTLNKYGYPSQLVSKSSANSGTTLSANILATPDVTSITPGRYAMALAVNGTGTLIVTNFNSTSAGASFFQEGFTDLHITGKPTGLGLDNGLSSGELPTDLSSTTGYIDQDTCPYMMITYGTSYTGE